jgi:hypothetical protein
MLGLQNLNVLSRVKPVKQPAQFELVKLQLEHLTEQLASRRLASIKDPCELVVVGFGGQRLPGFSLLKKHSEQEVALEQTLQPEGHCKHA